MVRTLTCCSPHGVPHRVLYSIAHYSANPHPAACSQLYASGLRPLFLGRALSALRSIGFPQSTWLVPQSQCCIFVSTYFQAKQNDTWGFILEWEAEKSPHTIELDVRKPLVVLYIFQKDMKSRDSPAKFRIGQFSTLALKRYLQMYTFELTFEIPLC
jgi:hypothetical protein